MKNLKNTLFVVTAALAAGLLAALLSGCDGSGGDGVASDDAGRVDVEGVVSGDAGRADVGKFDTVKVDAGKSGDSKVVSCPIPTPKFPMTGVGTTPRLGYVVLDSNVVPSCSVDPHFPYQPTACDDPVDGFASSSSEQWCAVDVVAGGGGVVLANFQNPLRCLPAGVNTVPGTSSDIPGDVAVCSASGVFVGWAFRGAELDPVLTSRTVPAVTCTIPVSKRQVSGADHLPTDGYRKLVGVYGAVPCSTQSSPLVKTPTDCGAPVDGFEATTAPATAFCCVKTTDYYNNDPTQVVFEQLSCDSPPSAGKVALCTEDGIFAGWEC